MVDLELRKGAANRGHALSSSLRQDRAAIRLFLIAAFGAVLLVAYHDQIEIFREGTSRGQVFGRDFAVFWTASWLALQGEVLSLFDNAAFAAAMAEVFGRDLAFMTFPYPPHALFAFLPFGGLPYLWAYALWVGLGLGLYLLPGSRGAAPRLAALALLLAPPTLLNVIFGQNGFLTAALLVGGVRLLPRHPVAAGMLIGCLTIKPQLGLLLPFALAAGGHWRAIASACLTALALLAASWLVHGTEAWLAYFSESVALQAKFLEQGQGMFMSMVPSPFMAARLLGLGVSFGYLLQAAFAAAMLAAVVWVFRRPAPEDLKSATLLAATFLASPYVFNYDMTILAAAVLLLAAHGLRRGFLPGEQAVLAAAWLLPLMVMFLNPAKLPLGPVILGALVVYALIRVQQAGGVRQAAPAH